MRLNINTATYGELINLPGIGEQLAMRILSYREANGPFHTVNDLQSVSGIGPRTVEAIEPFIVVEHEVEQRSQSGAGDRASQE